MVELWIGKAHERDREGAGLVLRTYDWREWDTEVSVDSAPVPVIGTTQQGERRGESPPRTTHDGRRWGLRWLVRSAARPRIGIAQEGERGEASLGLVTYDMKGWGTGESVASVTGGATTSTEERGERRSEFGSRDVRPERMGYGRERGFGDGGATTSAEERREGRGEFGARDVRQEGIGYGGERGFGTTGAGDWGVGTTGTEERRGGFDARATAEQGRPSDTSRVGPLSPAPRGDWVDDRRSRDYSSTSEPPTAPHSGTGDWAGGSGSARGEFGETAAGACVCLKSWKLRSDRMICVRFFFFEIEFVCLRRLDSCFGD